MPNALNVVSIHRNLRGARYTRRGAEAATSDIVEIRSHYGDIMMDYDDFKALAEGLIKAGPGPEIAPHTHGEPDF